MADRVGPEGSAAAKLVLLGDIERWIAFVRVIAPTGCWLWTAGKDRKGYGKFWYAGRTGRAHRFAYETFRGKIPEGLEPDHLCRHPGCVNPDHLEAVTRRENLRRGNSPVGINARKLHCINGHLFDEANTYWHHGMRYCRACNLARYHEKRRHRAIA